jgi:hypothetical protein
MKGRNHRVLGILAATVAAAAVVVPVAGAAGSSSAAGQTQCGVSVILRNDIGHFGGPPPTADERSCSSVSSRPPSASRAPSTPSVRSRRDSGRKASARLRARRRSIVSSG